MQHSFTSHQHCLTDDEVITMQLVGRQEESRFRLRIWRRVGSYPVVLVSQIEGQLAPSWATSRLANYISQAYLSCSPCSYWEAVAQDSCTPADLFVVFFESFGLGCRARLVKPITKRKPKATLEALVGQRVDLQ